jgi:hypothetical protein
VAIDSPSLDRQSHSSFLRYIEQDNPTGTVQGKVIKNLLILEIINPGTKNGS